MSAERDDDGDTTTTSEPTGEPTESPTTAAPSTTAAPTTETSTPATTAVEPVLEDGQHAAFLTAVDSGNRTVEFDVIQYLTGEEANEAYREDHPGWTDDAPNDHYIINENPRLRTLPVASDVEVSLVTTPEGTFVDPYPAAFEMLEDIAATPVFPPGWHMPFWLTVDDDTIVALEEIFVP